MEAYQGIRGESLGLGKGKKREGMCGKKRKLVLMCGKVVHERNMCTN